MDRGVCYLKARFPEAEAWQVSGTGGKDYPTPGGIRVCPALALLVRLIYTYTSPEAFKTRFNKKQVQS